MKKHFILAAMATTALLAGCSNEEENLMPNAGAKVSFVIDGPVTRTTTGTDGTTSFVAGDKIAVYSTGLTNNMSGAEFTVADGGELTGETYTFNGTDGAKFYAYYPTTATGSATDAVFTVAEDQSATGTFNNSDFMTAKAIVDAATKDAISLSFAHRLALVKIELSGIADITGVEMNNVQPTATWTYNDDKVTTSGTTTTIKMGVNTTEYWAVIPAQTITTGTVLFTIQAGGKTYTYKPTVNDIIFNEGKVKKFKLTIAADGQSVVSLSTSMEAIWGEEVIENGNVTEEIKNYIAFASDATIASITNRKDLKDNKAGTPWGFFNNGTAEQNNGKFSITANSTNTSWYNRTLYFYSPEELPIGEYTLSFNIKSTTDKRQLQISLLSAETESNPSFYQVTSNDGTLCTQYRLNMTTEDKEYQIAINTAKIVTTASPANTEQTFDDNTTPLKGFFLSIAFPNDTYKLYNLKLVKK